MTTTEEVLAAINSFTKEYDVNNTELNKSIALNVYEQIDRFADGIEPTAQEIAQLTVAINEHIQVRDFLLGIPKERDVNHVGNWLSHIGNRTPRLYDVPMATILSSLYFSEGDSEQANHYLGLALEINPDYSLAVLLNRVYQSGWAPEGFSSMRNQLHDKVKAEIGL
jgi:tetratricopeptide (TPR) repeat protein